MMRIRVIIDAPAAWSERAPVTIGSAHIEAATLTEAIKQAAKLAPGLVRPDLKPRDTIAGES